MIRYIALFGFVLAMVLAAGCSQENTAQQSAAEAVPAVQEEESAQLTAAQQELVDRAVAIAKALEEAPQDMAGVLAGFSLSEEECNALFYEIAASPALTDAYQLARAE